MAALTLAALATGCGDDTADDDAGTASDTTVPSSSAPTSGSPSPTASATSEAPAVPALDPIVVGAVQGALDDQFPALIPTTLPAGWAVTGATYATGTWRIALTDATGTPVVLSQEEVALEKLLAATVGKGAEQTGKVDLKRYGLGVWGVHEAGTAVGIARELASTAVVITAVDADTAAQLGQTLLTAEDADMPEAG